MPLFNVAQNPEQLSALQCLESFQKWFTSLLADHRKVWTLFIEQLYQESDSRIELESVTDYDSQPAGNRWS